MRLYEIESDYASFIPGRLYNEVKTSLIEINRHLRNNADLDHNTALETLQSLNHLRDIVIEYLDSDEDLLESIIISITIIMRRFKDV